MSKNWMIYTSSKKPKSKVNHSWKSRKSKCQSHSYKPCRGKILLFNCNIQISYLINHNNLREKENEDLYETYDASYVDNGDDSMRGMYDPDYDMWEEWMGWEGAGIRDYTSHINPHI
ncbi:hypothetical protein ACHQM5_003877 [Ranunculus cassubicifolius]